MTNIIIIASSGNTFTGSKKSSGQTMRIQNYSSACIDGSTSSTLSVLMKAVYKDNFISKNSKREGIFVISPLERLNPKNELIPKGFLGQAVQQIKRPIKQKQFETAIKRLERFLQKHKEKIYYCSQIIDTKEYDEKEKDYFYKFSK